MSSVKSGCWFRLFLVQLFSVLLFHLRCIHLHRSTSESFSSPDQIRHIFGAVAFHRTLIRSPSLKTAITFAYGLGIRKFLIHGYLQKILHPILPCFAGFADSIFAKFPWEDCLSELRSFCTLFKDFADFPEAKSLHRKF